MSTHWDDDERSPYRPMVVTKHVSETHEKHESVLKYIKQYFDEEKEKLYVKNVDNEKDDAERARIKAFFEEWYFGKHVDDSASDDTEEESSGSNNLEDSAVEPENDPLFRDACFKFAYT